MNVASLIQGLILWTLNIIIAVMISFVIAVFLTGCESAPTTRSTATLPPIDKGAMQPYAETTTEPEPSLEPAVTMDERIVELIATADPAPTDVRRKKDNVRQTRPRHMNKAQWEATKEQP